MNTYEVVGPTEVPQAKTMYPGFAGGAAIGWKSNGNLLARLREEIERRITVQRRTSPTARQLPTRPTAEAGAAARELATRKAETAARQIVWTSSAAMPSRLREQIERGVTSSAAAAKERTEAAARQKAEAAREAARRAKVAVHPKRPAANAGIREWEAYYKATGTSLSPSHRTKLERPEKIAFAKATGSILFIPKSFTQQSGIGVSRGVTWMFPVAYGRDSMPYWHLWFDKKATAIQIGRKVAEDYKREIMRRVAIKTKYRTEREAWQDAGRPGPGPTIDPHEGIHSPITAPKTYVRAPERPPTTPPKRYVPAPRRAAIAPPEIRVRAPRRAAIAPPEIRVRAPGRRAYLPPPTLGQIPGAFSPSWRKDWRNNLWYLCPGSKIRSGGKGRGEGYGEGRGPIGRRL